MVVGVGQVRIPGDVAAGIFRRVHNAGGHIVGDRGAHHRDLGGGLFGTLNSGGGVGHNQIHIIRNEFGHDGGTVGLLASRILIVKLYIFLPQQFGEGVLKALGGLVQRDVLHLLADTDVVHPVGTGRGGRAGAALSAAGGGGTGVGGPAHTGGERQAHSQGEARGKKLFHVSFLLCEPVSGRSPFQTGSAPPEAVWRAGPQRSEAPGPAYTKTAPLSETTEPFWYPANIPNASIRLAAIVPDVCSA